MTRVLENLRTYLDIVAWEYYDVDGRRRTYADDARAAMEAECSESLTRWELVVEKALKNREAAAAVLPVITTDFVACWEYFESAHAAATELADRRLRYVMGEWDIDLSDEAYRTAATALFQHLETSKY